VLLDREQGGETAELAGAVVDVGALRKRIVAPAGAANPAVGPGEGGDDAAGGGAEAVGEIGHRDALRRGVHLISAEEVAEPAGTGGGRERDGVPDRGEVAARPDRSAEPDRAAPGAHVVIADDELLVAAEMDLIDQRAPQAGQRSFDPNLANHVRRKGDDDPGGGDGFA